MKPVPSVYQDESMWDYSKRTWYEMFRPSLILLVIGCVAFYGGVSTRQPGGYVAATVAVVTTIAFVNQSYGNLFCWLMLPLGWYRRLFAVPSGNSLYGTFPGVVTCDRRSGRVFFVVPAPGTNSDKSRIPELQAAAGWMLENIPAIADEYGTVAKLANRFAWQHKYDEFILVSYRAEAQPVRPMPKTTSDWGEPKMLPGCSRSFCHAETQSPSRMYTTRSRRTRTVWQWYYLIVIAVSAGSFWFASYLSDGGWPDVLIRVLAGVVGIGIGLLLGPLVVTKFADYLADRQSASTRHHLFWALAGHVTVAFSQLLTHFQSDRSKREIVLDGGSEPSLAAFEAMEEIAFATQTELRPRHGELLQACLDYYEFAAWHLEQIEIVLTPWFVQSSRNRDLLKALMQFANTRRSLDRLVSQPELTNPDVLAMQVQSIALHLEAIYKHLIEEWAGCLPKDHKPFFRFQDAIAAEDAKE